MRRSHLLYAIVLFLALCWQAAAQSLVYSVSYAETQASFAARFGASPFQRPISERLAMLRRLRKTEIYKVSMADGARVLMFSDEGKTFEVFPVGMPGQPLISATRMCVKGVEREWRTGPTPGAYSTPDSVYEISLDGSNTFRRLFETMPNLTTAIVNSSGTKALFESMENDKYMVYVYETSTWNQVHAWDLSSRIRVKCPECLPLSHGWLGDGKGLFFNITVGDEDGVPEDAHGVPGTYLAAEDGSSFQSISEETGRWEMTGYRRDTSIQANLIGQMPDGSFAFIDYAMKQPLPKPPAQAQSFLVLTALGAPARKVIQLREGRLGDYHLSPSGKYLAYTESRTTKDYRTERHLWVKNLESGEEEELISEPPSKPPSSAEPNQTYMVLGWMPE